MSKQVRNRGFSIAICAIACLAASLPAAGRISTITADPDPASCLGPVVVQATGWWPDGCWEIDQIDFEFVADVYAVDLWLFTVHATDTWVPGMACLTVIVEYSATETIAPLPEGEHFVGVLEQTTSLRETGQGLAIRFDVICCEPAPQSVTDLLLDKLAGDQQINFTWIDTADAEGYTIFEDASPTGDFEVEIGSAASGTPGADVTMPAENAFYLVASRNACGTGNKH